MTGSLSARPQLVSFGLATLFSSAWLATAVDLRPRWWLVPATWVWALLARDVARRRADRCGGGGGSGGAARCRGAQDRTARVSPRPGAARRSTDPLAPGLLLAPLTVRAYTRFVTEWRPPALGDPFFVLGLVLLAVPVLIWARSRWVPSWPEVGLLLLAIVLTLAYARTVALGAAIVAPVVALAAERVLPLRREPRQRREVALTASLAAVGLGVAAALAPGLAATPTGVPNALDAQLDALPTGTVVYNDYALGGWLHRRHPRLQPVIDGRTEIYETSYVESYSGLPAHPPGLAGVHHPDQAVVLTRRRAVSPCLGARAGPALERGGTGRPVRPAPGRRPVSGDPVVAPVPGPARTWRWRPSRG